MATKEKVRIIAIIISIIFAILLTVYLITAGGDWTHLYQAAVRGMAGSGADGSGVLPGAGSFADDGFGAPLPLLSLSYDANEETEFYLYKDYIAECSRDSFCLIDKNGAEVFRKNIDFNKPALAARGDYLLVFDYGGRSAFVMKGLKKVWEEAFPGPIVNASINKTGHIACVLEETGYRNSVRVFAPVGKMLFDWFVADDYVLGSEVAPSGRELIINRLKTTGVSAGSGLVFLDMKYEPFRAIDSGEDEIFLSARYLEDGALAVATENAFYLYSEQGEPVVNERFDYLSAFCEFPGKRAVVAVHRNNRELLIEYGADASAGNALVIAEQPVRNMTAGNGYLFINYGYVAEVVDSSGKTVSRLTLDSEIRYGGASGKIGVLAVTKKSADIYAF